MTLRTVEGSVPSAILTQSKFFKVVTKKAGKLFGDWQEKSKERPTDKWLNAKDYTGAGDSIVSVLGRTSYPKGFHAFVNRSAALAFMAYNKAKNNHGEDGIVVEVKLRDIVAYGKQKIGEGTNGAKTAQTVVAREMYIPKPDPVIFSELRRLAGFLVDLVRVKKGGDIKPWGKLKPETQKEYLGLAVLFIKDRDAKEALRASRS